MKEILEQINKRLQEAQDAWDESIYAYEEDFHRGEVEAYTQVRVLLRQYQENLIRG